MTTILFRLGNRALRECLCSIAGRGFRKLDALPGTPTVARQLIARADKKRVAGCLALIGVRSSP